ncbi:MAG: caspase family protein, partial [Cyanobacteria bacterium J06639_16]
MARIKRRQFLQAAGATLAALGWNQLEIANLSDRYGKVLAQNTPRKLALLVGINEYADPGVPPLAGCVTDTELQYRLLVHRFGFNPSDIVVLTDRQASREGILTAFEEHLIKQAKPGDIVTFHFSGHGSRVVDPDNDHADGLNSTLVPADSVFPANFPSQSGSINDITGHTLFLLASALQTENVTMVLDSCHSGGGTRGNLSVRSRAGGGQLQMSDEELAYQEQWLPKLNLTPETFIQQRRKGIAQGITIASAKRDQYAADYPFGDFFAGAFSYTLTQYLWQQPIDEPFNSAIPNVARATTQIYSGQEPQLEIQPDRAYGTSPVYFVSKQTPPAEAVITNVEGDEAEVWLGGVDPRSLETFRRDAVLTAVNAQGESQGLLKLTQRQGLLGRGQLLQPIESGSLLQEQTRSIPQGASLKIGLAATLNDQTEAARQALSALNRIEPLPLQQGEVHYIFGRFTADQPIVVLPGTPAPADGSLGLFSQGLEVIPGSFGVAGESVADGVDRLQAKLRSLLAARLVKLALNPSSSRLDVGVTMTPAGQGQIVASSFTA